MSEVKYLDKTGLGTVWGKVKALVSPKADKSEMSVTPGTGTDADKTTIQLKQGTSATVLTQHQDISGKADKDADAVEGHLAKFDANGNPIDGDIAINNVAQKDGSYDQMQVGIAKDLASSQSVPAEIVFRNTGGSTSVGKGGTAIIDRIKGKTVVRNQLVLNGDFASTTGWREAYGTISAQNNILTYTVYEPYDGNAIAQDVFPHVTGHKYLFRAQLKYSKAMSGPGELFYGIGGYDGINYPVASIVANTWFTMSGIVTDSGTTVNHDLRFYLRTSYGLSAGDTVQIRNAIAVDLTLMFGAGNEPSTVAEFEAMFPLPYYDYTPGTLISNDASAIETVGFNLWDEEWEQGEIGGEGTYIASTDRIRSKNLIPVTEGAYYAALRLIIHYYDAGGNHTNTIDMGVAGTFSIPSGVTFIKFNTGSDYGGTYNHDICINLSDPSRNGQYEPYWKSEIRLGLNSIKVKSHNIWDEAVSTKAIDQSTGEQTGNDETCISSLNHIPVNPSTVYYVKCKYGSGSGNGIYIKQFDANKNPLSSGWDFQNVKNDTFTTSANARYIKFMTLGSYGTTYNNDICINVSSSFNGLYEPHGDITITGGLKSAGDVYDEIVGNKYIKRVGSVDLGTVPWGYNPEFGTHYVNDFGNYAIGIIMPTTQISYGNAVAQLYEMGADVDWRSGKFYLSPSNNQAGITNNDQNDPPRGLLYYELATPIEYELVEALPTEYRVDSHGTERRLPADTASSVHAPFAADITYSTNIKETVENLPKNYINVDSMHAFLAALGTAMNGEWDMRQGNGRFIFTFTPNTPNTQNENE